MAERDGVDGDDVNRHERRDGALGETMVLFDWNGTIVVDADHARAALNLVLGRRGLPVLGETEFSIRFRLPFSELLGRLGIDAADRHDAEEEWNAELATMRTRLRPGAAECLGSLAEHGAWLGVLSASSASAVRFDQRSLAVPPVFHVVDASVDDKFEALLRHRPTRTRAYYVGDSADDMRCASAADYIAIGVSAETAPSAETADEAMRVLRAAGAAHVISSLEELVGLMQLDAPLASAAQV